MTRLKRNLVKEEKAQANVINGVVTLGIVGIIFGIMVMIFASLDPIILDSSASVITETFTTGASPAYVTLNYTMVEDHRVVLYNSTATFVDGTDYNVSWANSSIRIGDPNIRDMENSSVYDIQYRYQGDGYSSVATVNANVYKGFDLGSIAPLIMGATLVITIVLSMVGAFMYRKE